MDSDFEQRHRTFVTIIVVVTVVFVVIVVTCVACICWCSWRHRRSTSYATQPYYQRVNLQPMPAAGYPPPQQPMMTQQNYPSAPPGTYPTQPQPTMQQQSYPAPPSGSYPTQQLPSQSADPNAPPNYAVAVQIDSQQSPYHAQPAQNPNYANGEKM